MRALPISVALLSAMAAPLSNARAQERTVAMPTVEQIQKMQDAAPAEPAVAPKQPRKVLVWGRMHAHQPNPYAARALQIMGEKSGAFEAVVSEDPATLLPDSLDQYDGLVMNNIHEREPFLPPNFDELPKNEQTAAEEMRSRIQGSILDFVAGGKGIVGIHAATAALQGWQEYGEMMGGYYGGHIAQEVAIKLDDPDHPVNACFEGKGFRIHDEIYISREPYSRERVRVLLSLDLTQMDDPGKRPDKDYAVSWVRAYGKGRVFYSTLGHFLETYWNPLALRHFLAGIQFALGDLEGDTTPSIE